MKEISKKNFDGYKYVDGGVCAAKGFKANGLYCGIKENPTKKPDLCLVESDVMCSAAGVFTQNKVKGAPVTISQKNLAKTGGKAKGFILNSKNANTCNADGEEKAYKMCEMTAEKMGVKPEEILIAQTGVIGQILPLEPIEAKIDELYEGLSYEGNEKAAIAIMTTDTVKKEVAVEFEQSKITREDFIKELDRLDCQYKPGLLYNNVFLIKGNKIFQDNLFKSGICSVQSEPSMLVCNVVHPLKGCRVLDCCAAPGGKSVYMAALMGEGEVTAMDKYGHRVELIKANAARCGAENIVHALEGDASEYNAQLGMFDSVLLDAPCSGLGVCAGKPDIKLRITPEALIETESLQRRILDTAALYVRPGGALVYSTCTVRRGENQLQARRFLEEHEDFILDDAYQYAPGALFRREGDFISLMPHIDNTEGFFIARFLRKDN